MNNDIKILIENARERAKCNDLQGAEVTLRKAWRDAAAQGCIFPIKINSVNSLTRESTTRLVPCGHCVNCRNNKRSEWVTRMSLHNKYCAKYSYFITLTYKPYKIYEHIPQFLRNAYWREDDFNYNHRLEFNPCLCRYEHFQRFMKSLRKYHQDKMSFFACQEYGSTYGRPHFHVIIWTDKPLSKEHVVKSWSYNVTKSRKHPRFVSIGRIQMDDLNANGTNAKQNVNTSFDSAKCFAYVAKYCCKDVLKADTDKNSRFWLFYNDLRNWRNIQDKINDVFDKNIRTRVSLLYDWACHFRKYVRLIEEQDRQRYIRENYNKILLRDNLEILCRPDDDWQFNNMDFLTDINNYIEDEFKQFVCIKTFWKGAPVVLRKIFAPCCQMSRSSGIGMDYARSHYQDYSNGKFTLPQIDNVRMVFPRAFFRYVSQKMQGIFQVYYRPCAKSPSSLSFLVEKYFGDYFGKDMQRLYDQCYHLGVTTFEMSSYDEQKLLRSDLAFTDYRHFDHSARGLIFIDADGHLFVRYYMYNRPTRLYVEICRMDFETWLKDLLNSYEPYALQYTNRDTERIKNEHLFKYCCQTSNEILDTFFAEKFENSSALIDSTGIFKKEQYDIFKESLEVLRDVKYSKKLSLTSKSNLL